MLKPLITHFLQHVVRQNSWAKVHLMPFAGNAIGFDFVIIKANLMILEDGSLALGGETMPPQATVYAPPSLMLRILAKDDAAKMQFKITGDAHLATEVAKMMDFGHQAVSSVKETTTNLTEMLSEYWQEEQPMIAKKRLVEQFNTDVDTLRNDVARLEKRLAKLTKEITS